MAGHMQAWLRLAIAAVGLLLAASQCVLAKYSIEEAGLRVIIPADNRQRSMLMALADFGAWPGNIDVAMTGIWCCPQHMPACRGVASYILRALCAANSG